MNVQEKTLSLVATGGTCVLGAALVSWGHADGVLRAKLRKEQPPYPAMRPPRSGGPVTTCVSIPDCSQLWLGYSTGKILVYRSVSDDTDHNKFYSIFLHQQFCLYSKLAFRVSDKMLK